MSKYLARFDKVLTWFAATLMAGIFIVGCLQVFFRYVIQSSLFWTEEVGRYLLIWLVFIGAAVGTAEMAHIAVDVIAERFPRAVQVWLGRVSNAIVIVFCAIAFYEGVKMAQINMSLQAMTLPLPLGLFYAAVPVGTALIIINTLRVMLRRRITVKADSADELTIA